MAIRDSHRTLVPPRSAFTLLEVLLASGIGALLMAALYGFMQLQLRHAQIARNVVEESTLGRALLAKMTSDISQHVDPFLPSTWSTVSGSSGSSSGSGSGAAGGAGATPASGTSSGGGSSTSASSTSSAATAAATGSPLVFNVGVQGDNTHILLSISRLPREMTQMAGDASKPSETTLVSDLRRVMYWYSASGDSSGLARMEMKQATSDEALTQLSNFPDDPGHVVASEVKNVNFRYFDGNAWQDTWDGTVAGADGVTPMGPPVAIEISLDISLDEKKAKTYRHVVVIPTANGVSQSTNSTSPTG